MSEHGASSLAALLVDGHEPNVVVDQLDPDHPEAFPQDANEGELAATEEIMDAFKSGDSHALMRSLKNLIEMLR